MKTTSRTEKNAMHLNPHPDVAQEQKEIMASPAAAPQSEGKLVAVYMVEQEDQERQHAISTL